MQQPKGTASRQWPLSLLSGNSEMGKLILQRDWSATPLGPFESWPQSLITSITTALGSRFPTFLFWGPEFNSLCNDGYLAILGEKHPGALGSTLPEVWPEVWQSFYEMLKGVMATGTGSWAEDQIYYLERRNGYPEESYFTFSFSRILDGPDGFGGFSCSAIETTAKVIGERRIKTLREIASQSADQGTVEDTGRACVAALATNALDLPFVVLHWVSPGNGAAQVIGSFGVEIPERAGSGESSALAEVRRTAAPVLVAGVQADFKVLPSPPGRNKPEACYVLPVGLAGKDQVCGFLSVGLSPHRPFDEDYESFLGLVGGQIQIAMTRARAQQEALERAEDLARLDRAKTAFFSNISHEFRTPLTLLLGPLEDALGSVSEGKAVVAHEVLESAHRNALRLLKLVNTLLDFSRVEAGRVEVPYEPIDLATYTAELAAQFASVLERGGLYLVVKTRLLAEPAYIDRQMWEKILFNLLSNAFKFTFEGRVEVSLFEESGLIRLVVSDTGTGIPPDELPKLFQRFHRVAGARSRSFEGSGIGLSLVQELVKLHGGSIAVESTVGKGSRFTVSIPQGRGHLAPDRLRAPANRERAQAELFVNEAMQWPRADRTQLAAPALAPAPATAGAAKPLVLVVDDNPDMRAYVARLLGDAFVIETAADGVEGLAAASRSLPQLIISDVMMPALDGFGLVKQLRGQESTRLIPVILLSARAGDESTIEGLEAGADDYLLKPFSPRELLARVRAQLAMAGLRRDLNAERKARTALAEIRKLSILLDASPDHVFMLDRAGRFVYRNRAAAESLEANLVARGRAGEPTIGRSGRELGFEQPFLGRFEAEQEQAFNGHPVLGEVHFPTPAGPRDFEYILSPAPSEDGAVEYLVGITRDVHELKLAARVRDQFLSIASHELRTPLTSLKLQTQMRNRSLKAGGLASFSEEQLGKMFKDDERQINRLGRLVEDMLDISRLDAGHLGINRERVELTGLVKEVADRMTPHLAGSGVTLSVEAEREVVGSWDRYRLEQVLTALLNNAMNYGARKPVRVSVGADAARARIVIEDSGIGIARQDLDRIFGKFERAISASEVSGLGLGLYIARQIVDAHAGSIRVESEPGVGSRFTVELPCVAQAGLSP